MRVVIKEPVHFGHQVFNEGVQVDLPEEKARALIREKLAAPADSGGKNNRKKAATVPPAQEG